MLVGGLGEIDLAARGGVEFADDPETVDDIAALEIRRERQLGEFFVELDLVGVGQGVDP